MFSTISSTPRAHSDGIWSCSFHSRLNSVVTGGADGFVKTWNLGDGSFRSHELHRLGIVSVATDSNSPLAASSSLDSRIILWDIEKAELVRIIEAGPVGNWTAVFSPDGRQIATGSHSGLVNIFNVSSGEKDAQIDSSGRFITAVAYSPDGKLLACAAFDGVVTIYDTATTERICKLDGHSMPVRALSFMGGILRTGSDDQQIHAYDVSQGTAPVSTITGHTSWVLSVSSSPDGVRLASGSSDKTVKVWDTRSNSLLRTLAEHTDQVWGVSFDGNGSRLVSVSDDCSMNVFGIPEM